MASWLVFLVMVMASVAALSPVAYRDVQSIVLRAGEMTAGRRSVVPQMSNVGPAYDAALLPSAIQCSNLGWDGHQYTWKCQAQLANGIDLARTEVTCEDWDPPTRDARADDVMTAGSCGVEYALKGTPTQRVIRPDAPSVHGSPPQYYAPPPSQTHTYTTTTTYRHDDNDAIVAIVFGFFVILAGMILCDCCGCDNTERSARVRVTPAAPAPTVRVETTSQAPAPTVRVETTSQAPAETTEEEVLVETPAPTVRVRPRPAARTTVHVSTPAPAPTSTVYVSAPAPAPVYIAPAPTSSYTSGLVDGMLLNSISRPRNTHTHSETTHVIRESAPSSFGLSFGSGSTSSSSGSSSSSSSGTHTSSSFGGSKRR